ncbi:hypothetical protein TRAPUB_11304 [Trametes pubescens]|uniref:F-box domain-containing protein n=1 Tax=Trametes pubescens TaxID=154538 RepID=A0A1M2VX27_TRAPU|nr:hypothetical protein TRAPUB_11304 [Trametes pubescens]
MKRLRSVVVDTSSGAGLPFWVLDAIFSTPQVRSVQFGSSICLPLEDDCSVPKHLRLTGPVASLTSFRRPLRSGTWYSQTPEEADLLFYLFKQIHRTIEVVEMPIETAPLRAFRRKDWPCLRELVLRGGPRRSARAFMLEHLTRMPNLRVLKLELAYSSEAGPQCMFPPGWTGGCPWPNLEVLAVSNPHPDDELYANVPDSLQELTIRCYPRYYVPDGPETQESMAMKMNRWGSSPLTSAEMLRVLRRCGVSLVRLRHLEVELAASSEDIGLLRYIAAAFPSLAFLQILRYCTDTAQDVASWAALGDALAPLTKLRLLRVDLDLKEDVDGTATYEEALTALARPLSPTVRFICPMIIQERFIEWKPYRIVRNCTSSETFRLEHAPQYERIDGYWYVICSCM